MHYYLFLPKKRDRSAQQSSSGHSAVFKVNIKKRGKIKHETMRLLLKRHKPVCRILQSNLQWFTALFQPHISGNKLLGLWAWVTFKAIKTGSTVWEEAGIWRAKGGKTGRSRLGECLVNSTYESELRRGGCSREGTFGVEEEGSSLRSNSRRIDRLTRCSS